MAVAHVVTKKEQKAADRAQFTIVCHGLTKEEFFSIYRTLTKNFGCKAAIRNPTPEFTPKAVHEIMAHAMGVGIGGYAAKQAIDAAKELLVSYIKFKFMSVPAEHSRRVELLHGPKNKILYKFKDKTKSQKAKGKKRN